MAFLTEKVDTPTISVSMIVKNESSCLDKCLESIKGADEIVIVDTGSTDHTVEVAQRHISNVYSDSTYTWRDDFAHSRNQSLDLCVCDWVLIIDADEILEKDGINKLRKIVKYIDDDKHALNFNTVSSLNQRVRNKNIRMFRRIPSIRWKGVAHNYLTVEPEWVEDVDITIYYGHSDSHKQDPDRTLRILTKYVNNNPNCSREKYYLASELYYKKRYDESLDMFNNYLQDATFVPEIADSYMLAAKCYIGKGDKDMAAECCIKAIMSNPDFAEPFVLLSKLANSKNEKWLQFSKICTNEDVLFIRDLESIKELKL